MTNFERRGQPLSTFFAAGRKAFSMLILKTHNPYPRADKFGVAEPACEQWDRGWQSAADAAMPPRTRPAERKPYKRVNAHKDAPRKPGPPRNHPRWAQVKNER